MMGRLAGVKSEEPFEEGAANPFWHTDETRRVPVLRGNWTKSRRLAAEAHQVVLIGRRMVGRARDCICRWRLTEPFKRCEYQFPPPPPSERTHGARAVSPSSSCALPRLCVTCNTCHVPRNLPCSNYEADVFWPPPR
eukprot:7380703-Prymnesium_polylepis.2